MKILATVCSAAGHKKPISTMAAVELNFFLKVILCVKNVTHKLILHRYIQIINGNYNDDIYSLLSFTPLQYLYGQST
jgi:hypothetical protein